MKKIILNEKQFKTLINIAINENFVTEISSKQIQNTQKEISDRIQSKIQNGDENLINNMNRLGFVLNNRTDKEYNNIKQSLYDENGNIKKEVSDEIINAANILKKYVNQYTGAIRDKAMQSELSREQIDYLMRMRDLLDKIGLNALYDSSMKKISKDLQYGLSYDTVDGKNVINTDNFDINTYTDNKIKGFGGSQTKLYESLLNRYVDSKYGVNLNIPKKMFTNGSHKLPSDTLIINFASAERCPAWNECLVKNACYARSTEKFRPSQMYSNATKNVMWEAGHDDPELLSLLFRLIREYIINYTNLSRELKKVNIIMTPEELSEKHFEELPEEAINIINNTELKNIKRINHVRLNENGDFIGQWLIDAVDNEASDLSKINVTVTAYTCRTLQFEKVKNIIINASNDGIKSNNARYFYALEENIYDAYDETYGGENNDLVVINDSVEPKPQPLYTNGIDNGNLYYKCPCGRMDILNGGGHKADCYMCRFCYEPNKENKPVYVFVKVHGASKDEFNGRNNMNFGVSINYAERLSKIIGNKKQNNLKLVSESVNDNTENKAITQITSNTISSINNHLSNL